MINFMSTPLQQILDKNKTSIYYGYSPLLLSLLFHNLPCSNLFTHVEHDTVTVRVLGLVATAGTNKRGGGYGQSKTRCDRVGDTSLRHVSRRTVGTRCGTRPLLPPCHRLTNLHAATIIYLSLEALVTAETVLL